MHTTTGTIPTHKSALVWSTDCSSHHYHHYQYPPLSQVNSRSTLPYSSPQPSALYCNLSQPHPHQLNHRPSSLTSSLTQPPAHLLEKNRLLLVPQNTIFSNSSSEKHQKGHFFVQIDIRLSFQ